MRHEYSTVNKNWTSDLFFVPLEIVGSQVLAAFIVLLLVSIMRGTEETCWCSGRCGRQGLDAGSWGYRQNWLGPAGSVRALARRKGGLVFLIKHGLAKPAWHWSSRLPLRSVINCLSVVGAGLQRCPPEQPACSSCIWLISVAVEAFPSPSLMAQ